MDPTAATVAGVVGALTGLGTLGISLLTARSTARKVEVEAVSIALRSLREDYVRLDGMVNKLQVELEAWKRRYGRVCRQAELEPGEFITRPLGRLESDG